MRGWELSPRLTMVTAAMRLFLFMVAVAGIGVYLFFVFYWISDSYDALTERVFSSWVVPYQYGKDAGVNILESRTSQAMFFLWVTLLTSALATLLRKNLPKPEESTWVKALKGKVGLPVLYRFLTATGPGDAVGLCTRTSFSVI